MTCRPASSGPPRRICPPPLRLNPPPVLISFKATRAVVSPANEYAGRLVVLASAEQLGQRAGRALVRLVRESRQEGENRGRLIEADAWDLAAVAGVPA